MPETNIPLYSDAWFEREIQFHKQTGHEEIAAILCEALLVRKLMRSHPLNPMILLLINDENIYRSVEDAHVMAKHLGETIKGMSAHG